MSADGAGDRLDGWKEVAAHLGKDVTTAIRWERERGLPVHRTPGTKRSGIYAFRREIDAWLLQDTGPHVPAHESTEPPNPPERPARVRPARRWRSFLAPAVALAAIVGALAGLARAIALPPSSAERIEVQPSGVVAYAGDGSVVWRYSPGNRRLFTDVQAPGLRPTPRSLIADVDGDGSREVLVSLGISDGGLLFHDELFCFSARGDVRWSLALEDRLEFGGATFGPPWRDGHVLAADIGGEMRIFWSQNHHTWWPGVVLALDARGRRAGRFVHAGHVRSMATETRGERPLLLVGGISNAYRAASVAVLDARSVAGQGPVPAGSEYECRACDDGFPAHYLLFPPSDLNAASGMPYNYVRQIWGTPDGYEVSTIETRPDSAATPVGELLFRLTRGFELVRADFGDTWIPAHAALESAGRLDHGAADCPSLRGGPGPIRAWDPIAGWRELAAPARAALAGRAAASGPRDPG